MKSKALGFSIIGSIMIIALLLFINYTTSPGFSWFIYPVFAVLWWPIGVYFTINRNAKAMSLVGSILIIIFFLVVNYTTSPGFLWFIFSVFAVIWWPLGVFLGRKSKAMAIAGSVLLIVFFFLVNFTTSFGHPWFIYPSFAVLWWPLGVLVGRGRHKVFSIISALLISGFFIAVNLITSPQYPWFIHTVFAVMWWPLSVFLANKKTIKIYSLAASLMTMAYLVLSNLLLPASGIWFPYAIFPFLLWPAVMFAGKKASSLLFAVAGSLITLLYYTMLNLFLSPGHPWIQYMLLPVIWWPVSIMYKNILRNSLYLFISITIFMAYYGLLNVFVSPGHPWSLYMLYPYAWIAIGIYFGTRKKVLGLAVAATLITIVFCSIMNFVLTPGTIWAVFPVFAILWWPMSVYFFHTRKQSKKIKPEV